MCLGWNLAVRVDSSANKDLGMVSLARPKAMSPRDAATDFYGNMAQGPKVVT